MIIVSLMGGLGNQLFQWAFGQALKAHSQQVYYDISFYNNVQDRHFDLNFLGVRPIGQRPGPIVYEGSLKFQPHYLEAHDMLTFVGYWQTEKYFDAIASQIRRDFQASVALSYESLRIAEDIVNKEGSVALHVRRGDYLSSGTRAFHGLLDMDYYLSAMAHIRRFVYNPYFFVFSDDPDWAQSNFVGTDCQIIRQRPAVEDMWLMSKCRHAIIANSSFSWWGSWLGDDQVGRVIVAPKQWFAVGPEKADSTDIVPERWTKI